MTTARTTLTMTLLAAVACIGSTPPPLPNPICPRPSNQPIRRVEITEKEEPHAASVMCGSPRAVYFVDAAPDGRALPPGFDTALLSALRLAPEWFEPCVAPLARVEAVLPERRLSRGQALSPYAWRSDGHRRFWRVSFVDAEHGEPLTVSEDAHCAMVNALRTAAERAAGEVSVRVGAAWCAATPAGPSTALGSSQLGTNSARTWHLDALGAPSPVIPAASFRGPHMTIIDAGGPPADGLHPVTSWFNRRGQPPPKFEPHAHGPGMLLFTEALLPAASHRIHQSVALDDGGAGGVLHVARALDEALRADADLRGLQTELTCQVTPDHPLCSAARGQHQRARLMNLSLGWPAELERQRRIVGPGCEAIEDPMGGAIKYLVEGAAQLDEARRPILLVTAAGNRPPRPSSGAARATMTWPAELRHEGAILSVGAIDVDAQPTLLSNRAAEPYLVAPGQHVVTARDLPGPYQWQSGAAVYSTTPPGTGGYRDPMVFSGTSVAAALTTSALARAWHEYVTRDRPLDAQLSGRAMARLAYLTGVDLGRNSVDGVPVRALCATRLNEAARKLTSDARDVLEAAPTTGPLVSDVYLRAHSQRWDRFARGTLTSPSCDPRGRSMAMPQSFDALRGQWLRLKHGSEATWTACRNRQPHLCNYDDGRLADGYSAASIGPQPIIPACPTCFIHPVGSGMLIVVELSPDWPPGVELKGQHVVFTNLSTGDGTSTALNPEDFGLNQSDWSDLWTAGNVFVLEDVELPAGVDLGDTDLEVMLVTEVHQAGHAPIIDYNPLFVE